MYSTLKPEGIDLVYLDPPYVPRSDDNCYMKRYHFLEGLSCYWKGVRIMEDTRVKKIEKPYTPFSYRKTAIDAFDRLFRLYRDSIIVLSYSSNGYPDREELEALMRRYKPDGDHLREASPLPLRDARERRTGHGTGIPDRRAVESRQSLPPLRRTSSFLEGMGGLEKRSGLPVFWQIAHDVRRF